MTINETKVRKCFGYSFSFHFEKHNQCHPPLSRDMKFQSPGQMHHLNCRRTGQHWRMLMITSVLHLELSKLQAHWIWQQWINSSTHSTGLTHASMFEKSAHQLLQRVQIHMFFYVIHGYVAVYRANMSAWFTRENFSNKAFFPFYVSGKKVLFQQIFVNYTAQRKGVGKIKSSRRIFQFTIPFA